MMTYFKLIVGVVLAGAVGNVGALEWFNERVEQQRQFERQRDDERLSSPDRWEQEKFGGAGRGWRDQRDQYENMYGR